MNILLAVMLVTAMSGYVSSEGREGSILGSGGRAEETMEAGESIFGSGGRQEAVMGSGG